MKGQTSPSSSPTAEEKRRMFRLQRSSRISGGASDALEDEGQTTANEDDDQNATELDGESARRRGGGGGGREEEREEDEGEDPSVEELVNRTISQGKDFARALRILSTEVSRRRKRPASTADNFSSGQTVGCFQE